MIALIVFLLVLSFLVIIHELGHYLAAKWAGVRVDEFGLGYPPKAKTLFTFRGTVFSLNWIPFGGFVRLAGDDAESIESSQKNRSSEMDEAKESKKVAQTQKSDLFSEKTQVQRMIIILAGVFINAVFAMIAFSIVYVVAGIPEERPNPIVISVQTGSPAEQVGILEGDAILKINEREVAQVGETIELIRENLGEEVLLTVDRDGEEISLESYVRTQEETPSDQGSLGIVLTQVEVVKYPIWIMIPKGIQQGVGDSIEFASLIVGSLGFIAQQAVQQGSVPADVAGPVGIVHLAQREGLFEQGPLVMLHFAGLLSINLAIMNLLPIPALDGGRAVFILLESIIGKARRAKWEAHANVVGMVLLLSLIVLISIQDIARIVLQ